MTKAETKTLLQLLEEVPDHREGNTINQCFLRALCVYQCCTGWFYTSSNRQMEFAAITVSYALDAILRRCSAEEPYSRAAC